MCKSISNRHSYFQEIMTVSLTDQIIHKLNRAAELYHRLIVVVAPAGAGKTTALQAVKERTGAPMVNVNIKLSRRLRKNALGR